MYFKYVNKLIRVNVSGDTNHGGRQAINIRSSILSECQAELVEADVLPQIRFRQAEADNFYN
jgi:hypothetical protein